MAKQLSIGLLNLLAILSVSVSAAVLCVSLAIADDETANSPNFSINLAEKLYADSHSIEIIDSIDASETDLFGNQFNNQLTGDLGEPLRVDDAFRLGIFESLDGDGYLIEFSIAENYYLYKDKFALSARQNQLAIILSDNQELINDQFFGEQEIYRFYVSGSVARSISSGEPSIPSDFVIAYQGCWDGGICYPLQRRQVSFDGNEFVISELSIADPAGLSEAAAGLNSDRNYAYYLSRLQERSWLLLLVIFFIAGLGLTFTPCVLPMLPIMSSILTQKNQSSQDKQKSQNNTGARQMSLALTYIGVMSISFSALGFFSGVLGYGLRGLLGSQVFLIFMALLVVLLALSILGLVKFSFLARLSQFANTSANTRLDMTQQPYAKAALWGFLSPFIIGTCLSAPLAAAMIYLADNGNPLLGASALMALSLGMGVPLLLVVLGLGRFLPSAGPWLTLSQKLLAVLLLALAVFILTPLLPGYLVAFSYILLLSLGLYFVLVHFISSAGKSASKTDARADAIPALMASTLALAMSIVYFMLIYAPDDPLTQFASISEYQAMQEFLATNPNQANQANQVNQPGGKLLYYYADWCISCRELERNVFANEEVIMALENTEFVKIDITKNNQDSLLLVEEFDVFGPPSLIFIGPDSRHLRELDLIGYFDVSSLLARLDSI